METQSEKSGATVAERANFAPDSTVCFGEMARMQGCSGPTHALPRKSQLSRG